MWRQRKEGSPTVVYIVFFSSTSKRSLHHLLKDKVSQASPRTCWRAVTKLFLSAKFTFIMSRMYPFAIFLLPHCPILDFCFLCHSWFISGDQWSLYLLGTPSYFMSLSDLIPPFLDVITLMNLQHSFLHFMIPKSCYSNLAKMASLCSYHKIQIFFLAFKTIIICFHISFTWGQESWSHLSFPFFSYINSIHQKNFLDSILKIHALLISSTTTTWSQPPLSSFCWITTFNCHPHFILVGHSPHC